MQPDTQKRPVGRPRADGRPPLERREVLLTAGRLIADHGYAGTSLRMIAEALGTSAPAISQRFGSKVQLLNELVAMMASVSIRFHETLADLELPADVRLYRMVYSEVMALAGADHAPVSLFYLPELKQPGFEAARESRLGMMRFYRDVIEQGMENGIFHRMSLSVAVEQAFQLTETIIVASDRHSLGSPGELASHTAMFVLRGFLVRPSSLNRIRAASERIDLSMT